MQEMSGSNQVAVFVDEEGIPVKKVVVPLFGGRLVQRVDDRTNRFSQAPRIAWFLGRPRGRKPKQETHCKGEPNLARFVATSDDNVAWHGMLRHRHSL